MLLEVLLRGWIKINSWKEKRTKWLLKTTRCKHKLDEGWRRFWSSILKSNKEGDTCPEKQWNGIIKFISKCQKKTTSYLNEKERWESDFN